MELNKDKNVLETRLTESEEKLLNLETNLEKEKKEKLDLESMLEEGYLETSLMDINPPKLVSFLKTISFRKLISPSIDCMIFFIS